MGKKKGELDSSQEDVNIQGQPSHFWQLDLINTIINNRKEDIRSYRTIIASTIIAAIAIPLGILSVPKSDIFNKNIWIFPNGLYILFLWICGFVLLFKGIRSFLFAEESSREDDFNLRLIRAWKELEKNEITKANQELFEGIEESNKFLTEGKKALKWTLFAMVPILLSVLCVYFLIIFWG